jgi:pantetheine-phosphate adenylyltransferase
MQFRRAIYPGTYDPAHYGHLDIAVRAARMFDEVIVAVYDQQGGRKMPLFTGEERQEMMRHMLRNVPNVKVALFHGLLVDYARQVEAYAIIRGLRVFSDFEFEFRMALANRRLAPELETVTFIADERHLHISSSTVREIASFGGDVSSMVPPEVVEALRHKFGEPKTGTHSDYMISLQD